MQRRMDIFVNKQKSNQDFFSESYDDKKRNKLLSVIKEKEDCSWTNFNSNYNFDLLSL